MKVFFSLLVSLTLTCTQSFASNAVVPSDTVTSLIDKAGALKMMEDGKKLFDTGKFKDAITKFREASIRDPRNATSFHYIAKCHFQIKNYGLALNYALRSNKINATDGENLFLLGEAYTRTNNLDSAFQYMELAEMNLSKSRIKDLQIALLKESIAHTQELLKTNGPNLRKPIEAMSISIEAINTPFNEYGFIQHGGTAYFTGRRNNTVGGGVGPSDQEYFEDIYSAKWNATNHHWDSVTNKIDRINSVGYDAVTHISADGLTIYLTVNTDGLNLKTSTGSSDLYFAEFTKKGKWTNPKAVKGTSLNTSYSESGATITADGNTMYFVTDRKGDKSGTDIYVSQKVGKTWGAPKSVSDSINTMGRETTPFISADGRYLFFSSDGFKGMGGYDVYVSENLGKTWSKPRNLGTSVNTTNDDTHFRYDEKTKQATLSGIELLEGKGTIDIFTIDLSTKDILKK